MKLSLLLVLSAVLLAGHGRAQAKRPPIQESGIIVIKNHVNDPETKENTSTFVIDEVKYAKMADPDAPREIKPEIHQFLVRTINFKASIAGQIGFVLGGLIDCCKKTFGAQATPVKLVIIKFGDMKEGLWTEMRIEGCAPEGLKIYELFPRACYADFATEHQEPATFQYMRELMNFCADAVHAYDFQGKKGKPLKLEMQREGAK